MGLAFSLPREERAITLVANFPISDPIRPASASGLSSQRLAPNPDVNINIAAPSAQASTQPIAVAPAPPLRPPNHLDHAVVASTNLPTVPTPINTSALSHYLYGYNEQAASFLFPLRYDGPQHLRFSQSHKSALQSHEIVTLKLHKEVGLGRVDPFDDPPFANLLASPLGLVAKHEPGKFQGIHNCALRNTRFSCGPRQTLWSWQPIAKADIQDAFRIIPIRPQGYPFLGIMWDCKFYYDNILPMGESVSCQLFETLSGAVQWMLHEHSENKFPYSAIIFRSVFSGATYRRNRLKKVAPPTAVNSK